MDNILLLKLLQCHYMTDVIKVLITDCYKSYAITVGTGTYISDSLIVSKGILQGDCLSPLLFNIVINTFIKTIDEERIRRMEHNF